MPLSNDDDADRYVLLRDLPDGTVKAVHPVSSLAEGERQMRGLIEQGKKDWRLFDKKENRNVWPLEPMP
jgi:hypothetical protein